MISEFYQQIPLHISPIAFAVGSFSVRWYALSYIAGFFCAYLLLRWQIKRGELENKILNLKFFSDGINFRQKISNFLLDFLLVAFFCALIGGRVGYVLFYNLAYFLLHPVSIISPFAPESASLIGIYGMSYHGALVGVILGSWIFLKVKKVDFLIWADFISPAAAIGYFFGRIGNFANGELYGRITTSSWGMYFAADPSHLRFPSQLIEAFLEGLVLFAVLWMMRKSKMPKGCLFIIYIIGYACLRTAGEFFREPDPQIGFVFGVLTLGQFLSMMMLALGLIFLVRLKKNNT